MSYKTVILFNHKGGVSKTLTTFNLAWMLTLKGKKVLIIDCDPQCNMSALFLDNDFDDYYTKDETKNMNIKDALRVAFESRPWRFQREWRYWLFMSPIGLKESEQATFDKHIEFARRLEDVTAKPPYERFFIELSDEAISQMEVVFGPRMTEAERILAEHLLRSCGLDGKWRDSTLRIR